MKEVQTTRPSETVGGNWPRHDKEQFMNNPNTVEILLQKHEEIHDYTAA